MDGLYPHPDGNYIGKYQLFSLSLSPTHLAVGGEEIRRAAGAAVALQVAQHASGRVGPLAGKLPRRFVLQDARANELVAGELSAEEAEPQ